MTAAIALRSELLDALGVRHAFFTREGGVSRPPYDTLSFSVAAGDLPSAVHENRRRAARELGVDESRLHYVSQVHGVDVVERRLSDTPEASLAEVGDVVLSRDEGVACGVRSADCVPVLLAAPGTGWACAIHSGWRGTVANVVKSGVVALEARGVEASRLVAAVGPHLERCCFEIGADVAASLAAASSHGEGAISRGPPMRAAPRGGESTLRADLRAIVRAQLEAAGVGRVDDVRGCTWCEPTRFHSYRRNGAKSGRMLSAIVAGR
jgi:YfiH family protein